MSPALRSGYLCVNKIWRLQHTWWICKRAHFQNYIIVNYRIILWHFIWVCLACSIKEMVHGFLVLMCFALYSYFTILPWKVGKTEKKISAHAQHYFLLTKFVVRNRQNHSIGSRRRCSRSSRHWNCVKLLLHKQESRHKKILCIICHGVASSFCLLSLLLWVVWEGWNKGGREGEGVVTTHTCKH